MAYTEFALGQTRLADSSTTIYTADEKTIVRDMMICNTTGSAITVTIWIDQDGTTGDDTTAIIDAFSIPAQDFIHWTGMQVMADNATIKGLCSTANAITVTVSGVKVT